MNSSKPATLHAEIGKRIRDYRSQWCMSAGTFGLYLVDSGISSVTDVEAGRELLSIEQLYMVAEALRCRVSDLLPEKRVSND